jgi:hypothetical protein
MNPVHLRKKQASYVRLTCTSANDLVAKAHGSGKSNDKYKSKFQHHLMSSLWLGQDALGQLQRRSSLGCQLKTLEVLRLEKLLETPK